MNIRRRTAHVLPGLALSLFVVLAAPAHAQDRRDSRGGGFSASLRLNLGSGLHWTRVGNSRVEEVPLSERPGYDVFRYGGSYYAYQNDRWYMSTQPDGDFSLIDDRSVPTEFTTVPRDHWRHYPSSWQDRQDPYYGQDRNAPAPTRTSATLRIRLGGAPHWASVRGTSVREIPLSERPDYDVFGYGDSYYVYDNDRWYQSSNENGDYIAIDDDAVPREFASIPRDHWRHYPTQWVSQPVERPSGVSGSIQFDFGNGSRWSSIRGTRVREMRGYDRRDYDVFLYGGNYYVYSNDQWYSSRSRNGPFRMMDPRFVPREFSRIPRSHWRNYPSDWQDRNRGDRNHDAYMRGGNQGSGR